MFQSHAGSIEAPYNKGGKVVRGLSFNPTLVRLRREGALAGQIRGPLRFNPTLVRLRQPPKPKQRRCEMLFQSHAGSIEAALELARKLMPIIVSIPRWFD